MKRNIDSWKNSITFNSNFDFLRLSKIHYKNGSYNFKETMKNIEKPLKTNNKFFELLVIKRITQDPVAAI